MSADIQIINEALSLLGQPRISDRSEATSQARVMNVIYDDAYHYLLSSHAFSFALDIKPLTKNSNAIAIPPYKVVYGYPTGYLQMRAVLTKDGGYEAFTLDTNGIHVSFEKELLCQYIREVPEESVSPAFRAAFSYYLAWRIHAQFSDNASERQLLQQNFHEHWTKCVASNGSIMQVPVLGHDKYTRYYDGGTDFHRSGSIYRYYS